MRDDTHKKEGRKREIEREVYDITRSNLQARKSSGERRLKATSGSNENDNPSTSEPLLFQSEKRAWVDTAFPACGRTKESG